MATTPQEAAVSQQATVQAPKALVLKRVHFHVAVSFGPNVVSSVDTSTEGTTVVEHRLGVLIEHKGFKVIVPTGNIQFILCAK